MGSRVTHGAVLGAVLMLAVVLTTAPLPAVGTGKVPAAPRSVTTEPGDGQVTVSWRPPASTRGARVTRYRVVHWRAGSTTKKVVELKASARKLVVRSLTNGTRYVFRVAARNKLGWGAWSPKRSAVPRTMPDAVVAAAATPRPGAIGLTWAPPSSDGGANVDRYAVRQSVDGGQTWTPSLTDSGTDEVTTTSTVVDGLRDGSPHDGDVTPYRLEVRAHNVVGWGPWTPARLAPDALEQMPPFVPGNQLGDAAAAALRDRLTGSWWTEGYPTPAGAGEWRDGGPLVFPIPPSCGSNPAVACPGGVPQDPPPSLVLDLAERVGDAPRRTVTNDAGQARYSLTYRARVGTPEPIAMIVSGNECTLTIDSTQGTSPDLRFDAQVQFSDVGWQTRAMPSSSSVSGLEGSDYSVDGSFACRVIDVPSSVITGQLQSAFQNQLNDRLGDTCGADVPDYWQPCFPILDNPPSAPPPAAPSTSCPAGPPVPGPYLTLTCDGKKLVRTCATGWVDADELVASGCESRATGVVPLRLDAMTGPALADHLSGSFFLGGYPGGVGTGDWYAAPDPVRVPLRACGPSDVFGCPSGVQQTPLPVLELDLTDVGDPGRRRQGAWDPETGVAHLTLRGRSELDAPVAFSHSGVGCQIEVDTTNGSRADLTLNVAAGGAGDGPLTISGYFDGGEMVTVQGLEDEDVVVGPHGWCAYWARGFAMSQVRTWVRDHLVAWAQRQGALCGAPEPYFWQHCP